MNDFRLLLLMYLLKTCGGGCRGLTADNAEGKTLQIHLEEGGCAHVQRFFLHPEPGCLAIFLLQGIDLLLREGIELLYPDQGDVGTLFFVLPIQQIVVDLARTE